MIHLTRSMPSGNIDEPVTATNPEPALPRSFRLPADYYTAPVSDVRPLFPKWVPIGCGATSAVILVLLFAGGALLTGPRLAAFIDLVVGQSVGELKGMYAKEISEQQKTQFDAEVKKLRDDLRADKISVQNMQPFLKTVQTVSGDKKVTPDELEKLTKVAHEAIVAGRRSPVAGK